ncbi:MarR family winged helix-turn-helix transcriptional regulator [Parvibaculum sp.]|uniref:MarR family winged helix-turn-helix transcriptional regulator n=1 Tax=Parvibaculum sp. TaxID=2024848 RepID=UPI002CE96B8D|nr:MarR family winged helix-turn-helix transcriptional regulator [Parvibaculum sp.]HUD52964.1 MarR family winged helix-turn-helix transcriptional regulator [Parvibaculum sp.]
MSKSDPQSLSVRAIIALYREFERVMREGDISLAQYRTMLYLKGGAKRAGAIAAAGAVKKPTVSAMLNNLREKGWITDEADPVDGRAIAVALTPAGLVRIEALEKSLSDHLAEIVPEPDLSALRGALASAYIDLAATQDERLKDIEKQFLG